MEAFHDAFTRLADVDGLERAVIERATATIEAHGVDVELWGPSAESSRYVARVTFRTTGGMEHVFSLTLDDKESGRRWQQSLGRGDAWWWPYRFARVELTKKKVRIHAAKSERAAAYLKDAPRLIELDLAEIVAGQPSAASSPR